MTIDAMSTLANEAATVVDTRCDFCIAYDFDSCSADSGMLTVTSRFTGHRTREEAVQYLQGQYPNIFGEAARAAAEADEYTNYDEWLRQWENEVQYAMRAVAYDFSDLTACNDHWSQCEHCGEGYIEPMSGSHYSLQRASFAHRNNWPLQYIGYSWDRSERLCQSCSSNGGFCASCDSYVDSDDMRRVEWDSYWCDSCVVDEGLTYCQSCDMYYPDDNLCECLQSGGGRIESYSYRPCPLFRVSEAEDVRLRCGRKPADILTREGRIGIPFMGFELEVESEGNSKSDALDVLDRAFGGLAYYKHDGSLNDGFEIVTHPMTLAAHAERIDWSFCKDLTAMGFRSWQAGTCGLHVHLSRAAFRTNTHLALFQHLFYKNQAAIARLAGRNSGQWASFDGAKGIIVKHLKGEAYRGRYEAINMTNTETVEIRVFRGSLKQERVRSALQLIDAAFWYTKGLHSGAMANGQILFPAFSAWVREVGSGGDDKYYDLIQYLDSGNL